MKDNAQHWYILHFFTVDYQEYSILYNKYFIVNE